MTMLALLRECDVPETVLEGFQNSARVAFIHDELAEMIPRLAQYLRGS
jgi:hypothetical protein